MAKIGEWDERSRRTVLISVEDLEPIKGQGKFEIIPKDVEIIWERWAKDEPESVFKISVRGPRVEATKNDNPTGIRVWFPAQESHDPAGVPEWLTELTEIFTRYDDLSDQLRSGRKLIKWLR